LRFIVMCVWPDILIYTCLPAQKCFCTKQTAAPTMEKEDAVRALAHPTLPDLHGLPLVLVKRVGEQVVLLLWRLRITTTSDGLGLNLHF